MIHSFDISDFVKDVANINRIVKIIQIKEIKNSLHTSYYSKLTFVNRKFYNA